MNTLETLQTIETNELGQQVLDGFREVALALAYQPRKLDKVVDDILADQQLSAEYPGVSESGYANIGRNVLEAYLHNQKAPNKQHAELHLIQLVQSLTGRTALVSSASGQPTIEVQGWKYGKYSSEYFWEETDQVVNSSATIKADSYYFYQGYNMSLALPKRLGRSKQRLRFDAVDAAGEPLIHLHIV